MSEPEWAEPWVEWLRQNDVPQQDRAVVARTRWGALDSAAWRRCEIAARRSVVTALTDRVPDDEEWGAVAACRDVIAWLDAGMPRKGRARALQSATVALRAAEPALAAQARETAARGMLADDLRSLECAARAVAAAWAAVDAAEAFVMQDWLRLRNDAAESRKAADAILDAIEAECTAAEAADAPRCV